MREISNSSFLFPAHTIHFSEAPYFVQIKTWKHLILLNREHRCHSIYHCVINISQHKRVFHKSSLFSQYYSDKKGTDCTTTNIC